MPELKNCVPSYRRHKRSGQAAITLNGHDHYLGQYGTAKSRSLYERLIGERLNTNRQRSAPGPDAAGGNLG